MVKLGQLLSQSWGVPGHLCLVSWKGQMIIQLQKVSLKKIKHMIHGFPQPHQHRNQEWR